MILISTHTIFFLKELSTIFLKLSLVLPLIFKLSLLLPLIFKLSLVLPLIFKLSLVLPLVFKLSLVLPLVFKLSLVLPTPGTLDVYCFWLIKVVILLLQYIRLSNEDSVDHLITLMVDDWKIIEPTRPSLVISVVGGAKNFKYDGQMRDTFSTGLIKVRIK